MIVKGKFIMERSMTKKTTQRKSPPDWFDLKKYQSAKNLNAEGWLYQLFIRRHCIQAVLGNDDGLVSITRQYLDKIFQYGIVPYCDDEINELYIADFWNSLESYHALDTQNVFSLKVGIAKTRFELSEDDKRRMLILEHKEQFSQKEFEEVSEYFLKPYDLYMRDSSSGGLNENYTEKTSSLDVAYDAFNLDTKAHAVVNLAASDEQIISDFKQWLTNCRALLCSESVEKLFSKEKLKVWSYYGVLPFLDLVTWMALKERRLTFNTLGKLVLGHLSIDTTDSIGKTSLIHAKKAISCPVILALR